MRAVPDIIGPIFLALVLVITVDPVRGWIIRLGAPRWLATLAVLLVIYAILIGMVVAAIIGAAQFASILPQYSGQISEQLVGADQLARRAWASVEESVQAALSNVDSRPPSSRPSRACSPSPAASSPRCSSSSRC